MLAVVCSALLISRLGSEVAQARWQQLSPDEQQRLRSKERWLTSFQQLATSVSLKSSASFCSLDGTSIVGAHRRKPGPLREKTSVLKGVSSPARARAALQGDVCV